MPLFFFPKNNLKHLYLKLVFHLSEAHQLQQIGRPASARIPCSRDQTQVLVFARQESSVDQTIPSALSLKWTLHQILVYSYRIQQFLKTDFEACNSDGFNLFSRTMLLHLDRIILFFFFLPDKAFCSLDWSALCSQGWPRIPYPKVLEFQRIHTSWYIYKGTVLVLFSSEM